MGPTLFTTLLSVPNPTDINSGNVDSVINVLIQNVVNIAYTVVGIVAVVFVIIGGIQLITSAGNPDGLKKARKTITYAVLGIVLALCTAAINTFIRGAIK